MSWKRYVPGPPLSTKDAQLSEWIQRELTAVSDTINTEVYRWDDLRFPAANLQPGTSNTPTWNNTYGLQEFDVNDLLFAQMQLPHAWKEGTVLKPHVHWMKITSATGNVNWQLDYRWVKIGDTMDGSWTTLASETPTVSDGDTAWQHALTSLGDITVDGSEQISDMLVMKISRVAAAGTEYGTRAALLEFDIHIQLDAFGSELLYSK